MVFGEFRKFLLMYLYDKKFLKYEILKLVMKYIVFLSLVLEGMDLKDFGICIKFVYIDFLKGFLSLELSVLSDSESLFLKLDLEYVSVELFVFEIDFDDEKEYFLSRNIC